MKTSPIPDANTPSPQLDAATEAELDRLLDPIFTYGIDWTEYKDKSEADHEVSTFAGRIKTEFKAEAKAAIARLLIRERIDELLEIGLIAHKHEAESPVIWQIADEIDERRLALQDRESDLRSSLEAARQIWGVYNARSRENPEEKMFDFDKWLPGQIEDWERQLAQLTKEAAPEEEKR